jgi:hypothetical protein
MSIYMNIHDLLESKLTARSKCCLTSVAATPVLLCFAPTLEQKHTVRSMKPAKFAKFCCLTPTHVNMAIDPMGSCCFKSRNMA